jgi:predicted nucleotidyltransferase
MSDIDIVYEEKDPHNPDLELLIMPAFLEQKYLHRPVDLIYKP